MHLLPTLTFPNHPHWDWGQVLQHYVPGDPYVMDCPEAAEYYRVKNAVATFLKPASVCEIGVRAGYSAAAFLQCGFVSRFVGFDLDDGSEGGIAGFSNYARANIASFEDIPDKNLYIENTQLFRALPHGPFDFVHIDGDHTYSGALHDITISLNSHSKWILVDDFDLIEPVRFAVLDALDMYKLDQAYYVPDGGYRGNVLIRNPQAR